MVWFSFKIIEATHQKIWLKAIWISFLLICLCIFFAFSTGFFFSNLFVDFYIVRASLVAQLVKNMPAMWKTWVWFLGWEDPLEKGKATHSSILAWRTHSSILAWRIPWTSPWGCKESDTTERLLLFFHYIVSKLAFYHVLQIDFFF